jgi:hypothetical protein
MRTFTRILLLCTVAAAIALPAVTLADPQRREETKEKQRDAKKAPAKAAPTRPPESKGSERIEEVRSRMKARDKEIDRIMNKDKKR